MMEKAAIRIKKKYADCIALHLDKKATADKCLFSHAAAHILSFTAVINAGPPYRHVERLMFDVMFDAL